MKIHQHDGVVVDAAGFRQGFAKHKRVGEVPREGEREAPGLRVRLPSLPSTIYRGQGGAVPSRSHLDGGRRPRGWLAPQVKWDAPHPQGFQP